MFCNRKKYVDSINNIHNKLFLFFGYPKKKDVYIELVEIIIV